MTIDSEPTRVTDDVPSGNFLRLPSRISFPYLRGGGKRLYFERSKVCDVGSELRHSTETAIVFRVEESMYTCDTTVSYSRSW